MVIAVTPKTQVQKYRLFTSYSLTESLLPAWLGRRAKGDFWMLALCNKAEGNNSNNVEILPVISFGRHGGHKYTI